MLTIVSMIWSITKNSIWPRIAITPNMIVMLIRHQEGYQNAQTNIIHQKHFRHKNVAKYITPNSDIDNLLIKQQIANNQIDMDKTCQHHRNKQEHNMSARARGRTTITTTLHPSIRSTSNHQQEEEEQLSQQCHA